MNQKDIILVMSLKVGHEVVLQNCCTIFESCYYQTKGTKQNNIRKRIFLMLQEISTVEFVLSGHLQGFHKWLLNSFKLWITQRIDRPYSHWKSKSCEPLNLYCWYYLSCRRSPYQLKILLTLSVIKYVRVMRKTKLEESDMLPNWNIIICLILL